MYPALVRSELSSKKWNEFLSQEQSCIMHQSHIGVARLSLAEVTCITQIGEDISNNESNPVFIMVIGKEKKENVDSRIVLVRIDKDSQIAVVRN
jgi:hypothetical protein